MNFSFASKANFPTEGDMWLGIMQGAVSIDYEGGCAVIGDVSYAIDADTRGGLIEAAGELAELVGHDSNETRLAVARHFDTYFGELAAKTDSIEVPDADTLLPCHVDIDGIYAEATGDELGLRAYMAPTGNAFLFPIESVEAIIGVLQRDHDDYPICMVGDEVLELVDGKPLCRSKPVTVGDEEVWFCGYDFTFAPTEICGKKVGDGFITPDEVTELAKKAAGKSAGGGNVAGGVKL